jgi:hypothetical protein
MKKSKFSEQQIAFALQQAEGGKTVSQACCKMGYCRSHVLSLEAALRRIDAIRSEES